MYGKLQDLWYNEDMEYQFKEYKENLSNSSCVIFIDYDVCDELTQFIDRHFISICAGNSSSPLNVVKENIKNYLKNKSNKQKIGAVAEFFAHLYFINNQYKQECLFTNLEELSAKKGFDGVYSNSNNYWIMESKARNYSSSTNHNSLIVKAYNDLNDKFSGKVKKGCPNNPWRNAYNHASHADVNSAESLKKQFNRLADEYTMKKYRDSSEFNIIPCSTIINDEIVNVETRNNLIQKLKKKMEKFKYKKIICVAISNRIYNYFINYLEA